MLMMKSIIINTKRIFLYLFIAVPLVACAEMDKKHNDDYPSDNPGNKISDYEFSIVPDKVGNGRKPTVKQKGGPELSGDLIPKDVPVKASSIEEIQTITIVRAKGSHYFLVTIDGVTYKFNLPH